MFKKIITAELTKDIIGFFVLTTTLFLIVIMTHVMF